VPLFLHCLFNPTGNDLNTKGHDDENHTVGRRLLTFPIFELIPPNVERWKTSAPSVACACEITLSIYSKNRQNIQNKLIQLDISYNFEEKSKASRKKG